METSFDFGGNMQSSAIWTAENIYMNDEILTPLIELAVRSNISDIYITEWEEIKVKRWAIYVLAEKLSELPFPTIYNKNMFNEMIQNIFHNDNDRELYLDKMKNVWEYDYGIGFQKDSISLRLRLHFVTSIQWVKLVIRPLLYKIPPYNYLTDNSWMYSNKSNQFLTEDIIREFKNCSHVGEFILSNFLKSKWLIFITWKTGTWKSTLTTSFLNEVISQKDITLVTIEDPIEYIFNAEKLRGSEIIQIEVPTHVKSFEQAIKGSKRENPDIVYIQEIRDKESALALIDLLWAWHLVVTTLHTGSITETFDRFVNLVGVENEALIRTVLADQLLCVINQKLLRFTTPDGKIMEKWVQEYLHINAPARKHIREKMISSINWLLIDSPPHVSLTKTLWLLFRSNQITVDQLLDNITDISLLETIVKGNHSTAIQEEIINQIKWDISIESLKKLFESIWEKPLSDEDIIRYKQQNRY